MTTRPRNPFRRQGRWAVRAVDAVNAAAKAHQRSADEGGQQDTFESLPPWHRVGSKNKVGLRGVANDSTCPLDAHEDYPCPPRSPRRPYSDEPRPPSSPYRPHSGGRQPPACCEQPARLHSPSVRTPPGQSTRDVSGLPGQDAEERGSATLSTMLYANLFRHKLLKARDLGKIDGEDLGRDPLWRAPLVLPEMPPPTLRSTQASPRGNLTGGPAVMPPPGAPRASRAAEAVRLARAEHADKKLQRLEERRLCGNVQDNLKAMGAQRSELRQLQLKMQALQPEREKQQFLLAAPLIRKSEQIEAGGA